MWKCNAVIGAIKYWMTTNKTRGIGGTSGQRENSVNKKKAKSTRCRGSSKKSRARWGAKS